jgi:hypothetical protein
MNKENIDIWSEEYFEQRRAERNHEWAEECNRNEKTRRTKMDRNL